MNNHPLSWTAPQPFWGTARGATAPHALLSQPQILRFTNDEFMNELLGTLEHDPSSLSQYAVMEETWRGPGAGPEPRPSRWLEKPTTMVLGLQRKSLLRARASAALAAPASAPAATVARTRLKLYQPAHQRHYLVSGSLVCQMPGLPDREVDPARQKVSFVLRRLFPKAPVASNQPLPDAGQTASWDEYAYVLRGKAGEWRKVAAADDEGAAAQLLRGEERLSMFPAFYAQDDSHRRRLFVGSVPVGRREAYQGAAADPNPSDEAESAEARAKRLGELDPRVVLFHMQVLGPWKALVNVAMRNGKPGQDPDTLGDLKAARHERVFAEATPSPPDFEPFDRSTPEPKVLRTERSGLQTSSWYLLLDLYLFLSEHLNAFWTEAQKKPTPAFALPEAQALFTALRDSVLPTVLTREGGAASDLSTFPGGKASLVEHGSAYTAVAVQTNLIAALSNIAAFKDALEAAPHTGPGTASKPFEIPEPKVSAPPAKPAGWPTFLFLFADPWFGVRQPPTPSGFSPPPGDYLSEKIQARIDSLADLLAAYLAAAAASEPIGARLPEPTLASMQPADMREAWYVMRLIYERPDCVPFHSTVVSAATRPFQMAGFFDADAPARPIRIGLPVDISPAGLRKFDKNAVFVMSDMLCGQVDRFKGLGLVDLVLSVLPWPFHKGLSVPDKGPCATGVMCSMSIPIITLCALILLTVIVSLLDLIFHWLPFFTVCFRLPGFKGKKDIA